VSACEFHENDEVCVHCLGVEVERLSAERDRYRDALAVIAGTDPIDAVLDPDRAIRVAADALAARRREPS